jgi:hypothetical protein
MSESCKDTLKGLEAVNLTDRQRARMKHAAQHSDAIVSALLSFAQALGLIATPAGR